MTTRVPQRVAILVCVLGFVLGRITARPKVVARNQLQSGVADRQDVEARGQASVLVQAALTGALLLITCLLAFEAVTVASHIWPITYYLRCANEAATYPALAAAFAFWLLAGRWLWLPTTPRDVG